MKLSKEAKNAIIAALNKLCEGQFDYGLPIHDDGQMALMRESIDEAIEGIES